MAGIFGDLIDSFTGAGARRELDAGIAAQNQGRDQALGAVRSSGATAQSYITPYRDTGGRGFQLYADTMGINGTGARDDAQKLYLSDDILQRQLDQAQKQRGWATNARNQWGTGVDALAAQRVSLENYNNWQNKLGGIGQQGQQAAGTAANIEQNTGNAEAGIYQNNANALAGLYGQKAQANNTFAQNLIGLGGTMVRAFNPLGTSASAGVNNIVDSQPGTKFNGGFQTTTYRG